MSVRIWLRHQAAAVTRLVKTERRKMAYAGEIQPYVALPRRRW